MSKVSIFVSYSWDSTEHKNHVQSFVEQLRKDDFEVYVDQDMNLGEEITRFMENGVVKCDRVLMICTPKYKEKADKRKGGVGYESRICTSEVYQNNESKFIPVLFEGTIRDSFPVWIRGNLGVDLSDGNFMGSEYQKLIDDLKKNSYLTVADRITNGQIEHDKKVKTKIVSIILTLFLCGFFFFLLPFVSQNYRLTITVTFLSLLSALIFFTLSGISIIEKKSWLTKLQFVSIFCISIFGMIFSINSIEIPKPIIIPGNVEVIRERPETIKISVEDGLEIYYTIDGSDPKELEEPNDLYNMSSSITFTLNKSTVVSARAKYLFFWSEVSERSYIFVAPSITNVESPYSYYYNLKDDMGNGGEFLNYDNRYLFRKYNSDSFDDGCGGFQDARNCGSKKISFMYSDGTIEELFNDDGYGPLYFTRATLYMNKFIDNISHVYSVDMSGQHPVQYGEGEIIGIDDNMKYIIYRNGQNIYAIDADLEEIVLSIKATGGFIGFRDNCIYYAVSVENEEKDFEKDYILQLKKFSFENQRETDVAYLTYSAPSSNSMPKIEKSQFVGNYVYFTFGSRGGSLAYYSGFVARLNLLTYEAERIVVNLNTSDFLVTSVSGEHYLYYYGNSEEYARINIDSRIIDYPPARTLVAQDVFEDEEGLCFYGKNNIKHTLIDIAEYEDYGYKEGQIDHYVDGPYFLISEINEFSDKIFFRIDIGYHDSERDVGWRPFFVRTKTSYYYRDVYTEKNVLIYEV